MKTFSPHNLSILACGIIGLGSLAMPAFAQDAGKLQELLRVIEAQQKQLNTQQKQLNAQSQLMQKLQIQVKLLAQDATTTVQAPVKISTVQAPVKTTTVQAPTTPRENVVASGGGKRAKLVVSGFVNKAVFGVDDGKNTKSYFVDNDNAESRVGFVGTLKATDDLTIGTNVELTIAPNKSGNVSQVNQDENNIFDQRKVEVSLDSERFGKLTLGKGDTASFNTGAADLSGTTVIAYATISDTAGGMLFREKNGGALTSVSVLGAFFNWDGLNRRSRLRYDTPSFHGFNLAASAISDSRYDAAVRWGGQGYGFKAVGYGAVADPNESGDGLNYDGSFSILHENTGLNFTVSAGTRERDNQSDPYNLYGKVGWKGNYFTFGETALIADYTRSVNLPTASDDGYSYGVAAVQQFDEFGAEIYALYRLHSLDRDVGAAVDDIGVVAIGTRVKF